MRSAAACPGVLDGAELFAEVGLEGTFVLRAERDGCSSATDPALADTPFRPQSTFKLVNTLIGLEEGLLTATSRWPWDGEPRKLATWEQDLDLGGALQVSCVPCFQELARAIGRERMAAALAAFDYGNQAMGDSVDAFWLDGGPLRLTPREQTEFVERMFTGALGVRAEHVELLWSLLEIERDERGVWAGKTGLGAQDGRAIGWLVGYVERDGARWTYATFVRSREGEDVEAEQARLAPLRRELTRGLLVRAGLWAAGEGR